MTSYLRRLLRTGRRVPARRRRLEGRRARAAAGLHAPPDAGGLRHGRAAADDDHPRLDRPAAGARRGVRALPLPRRRPRAPAAAGAHGDRHAARRSRRVAAALIAVVRRAGLARAARQRAAGRDPRRRARPVGVHEPRARLRAAAGGGARAGVRDRVAGQRRADRRCSRVLARRRPRRGRARPAARQLRRRPRSCCSACGGPSATSLGLPAIARAARPDAALRAADRARRGLGLRAVLRRPAVALPLRERRTTAGLYSLSVKLAGIVVFTVRAFQYAWPPLAYSIDDDAEAARVYARITTYYVLFTGPRRRRAGAARPLARADLRRAGVLRRPRGAAVGRARLGALRAVPGAGGDGRPRAGHGPQRARRAVRAGGQRRAAGAARAAARDRRRRPGAGRRLRRDARRDVGADAQPVPGRVRVGPARRCSCSSPAGSTVAGELLLPTDRRRRLRHPRAACWPRSRSRCGRRASSGPASSRPRAALLRRAAGPQPPVELVGGLGAGPRRGAGTASR